MTALILPSRGLMSQPQGPVSVDWSNPITKGLLEVLIPFTKTTLKGASATLGSGVSVRATREGVALARSGFDNAGVSSASFPGNWAVPAPLTVSALVYIGANSAFEANLASSYAGNNFGWRLAFVNQTIRAAVTWSGGSGPGVTVTHTQTSLLNVPILVTVVIRPTTFDLYLDGTLSGTSGAHSYAANANIPVSLFFFTGSGFGFGEISGVYQVSVWKRELSQSEIKSLSGNVWQLFKAPSKYIDIQPKQFFAPTQSKMLGTSIGQPATTVSTGRGTRGATRASQPQGPVGIDWSNPITRGLVFALNPISAFDLVKKLAVPGISPQIATSSGIYIGGVSSTQTSLGNGPVATSSTWTGLLDIDTRPNPNGWGGRFWRPTGNNDGQHTVQLGGTTGTKVVGVSINYAAIFNISLTDNSQSRCVIKHRAADHAIWVNGSLKGASSNAAAWSIGVNSSNVAGSDAIGLQLLWDRTLSDVEILSISLNPWQIFTPIQRNIWVPYP